MELGVPAKAERRKFVQFAERPGPLVNWYWRLEYRLGEDETQFTKYRSRVRLAKAVVDE